MPKTRGESISDWMRVANPNRTINCSWREIDDGDNPKIMGHGQDIGSDSKDDILNAVSIDAVPLKRQNDRFRLMNRTV